MTIINDPNSGDLWGRLGRSFGQGAETASQGIAKGITQNQQANALDRISQMQGGFDPLKATSSLMRGGFSSQEAQSLIPFLQQQQARKSYLEQAKDISGNMSQAAPMRTRTNPVDISQESSEELGNLPLSQQIRGANFLQPMTPEQRQQEAARLIQSGRFINPEDAENYVTRQEDLRLSGDQAFQQKQETADSEFNKLLHQTLQKGGVKDYYDVNGDLQRKFSNLVRSEVAEGGNPTQVANKYAKQALEFAKARQSLRDVGKKHFWNTSAKDSLDSFNSIRKEYEKYGQIQEFANDLISNANMTPEAAYALAVPISRDKGLETFIESKKPLTKLGQSLKAGSKSEKQIADYVTKNINKGISFLGIADKLQDMGLNKDAFWREIQRKYASGEISSEDLNDRQISELGKQLSPRRTFGDIYYKSLFFKNPWGQHVQ